ncbi:MAG: GNAT family N-acetyltransferase [Saccharofermentans sp.]|nr:GNAT family N-acetyltransferase [Saccharofermentans sp.]
MSIRAIGYDDIPECAEVIKAGFMTVAKQFDITPENAPAFTAYATDEAKIRCWMDEQKRPMYGFYEDGKLLGCYNLMVKDEECELGSLCVLPESRHKGIGEELLNDSIKRARELGCKIMKLSIVEENKVLRKWYESFGFIHTGTVKYDFFPFTCGYLEKNI